MPRSGQNVKPDGKGGTMSKRYHIEKDKIVQDRIKIQVIDINGKKHPYIAIQEGEDVHGLTFGLSQARIMVRNIAAIRKFVKDYKEVD